MNILKVGFTWLITFLFNTYLLIVLLHLIMQYLKPNLYNPIYQAITRLIYPVTKYWRRLLPPFKRFDSSTALLAILLPAIQYTLIACINLGFNFQWLGFLKILPTVIVAEVILQLINLYFYAILLRIILSWLQNPSHHAIADLLYLLTEPLLRPLRPHIPIIAGFDLSPAIVLIALKLIEMMTLSWETLHMARMAFIHA